MPLFNNNRPNLHSLLYPAILILLTVIVFSANYSPNTWQTGWDTLHPEFNFKLNIPRHLFGIWQENQGLGSVGGHSHAADISRIIILWIFSLFFKISFLRYFYLFLTLIFGVLGMYFYLRNVIFKHINTQYKRGFFAFFGALFYLFNPGTVQQYIVQLEMYTVLYAALPWIFLYSTKFLELGKKKYLKYLVIAVILGAPLAYSITVFLALFACLAIYLFIPVITENHREGYFKKSFFKIILIILVFSSYWLLPSLYFGLKHSSFVSISNINEHFSREIYAYNVKHGNLWDLLNINGFLIEWGNYDYVEKDFYPIMNVWNVYHGNPLIKVLQLSLGILLVVGLVALIKGKRPLYTGILSMLFLCIFMFLTSNPPFGFIFSFFKDNLNVLGELFRNPYTKFSVELIFLYSILISYGLYSIMHIVQSSLNHKFSSYTYNLLSFLSIVVFSVYMWPAYKGHFISTDVRKPIPHYYFEMYDWLNSQNDTRRIAQLPIHRFWGWQYYDWEYQGAGFLWFGSKQPVLNRDFDRWNKHNEEYYYEMSQAVYAKDLPAFEHIINKYGIGYVLVDESEISTGGYPDVTYTKEILGLLNQSEFISLAKIFGKIHVYKVSSTIASDFYSVDSSRPVVVDYPFMYGEKFVSNTGKKFYTQNDDLYLEATSKLDKGIYKLATDTYADSEHTVVSSIWAKSSSQGITLKVQPVLPLISVNDNYGSRPPVIEKELIFPVSAVDFPLKISIANKDHLTFRAASSDYTYLGAVLTDINLPTIVYLYSESAQNRVNVLGNTNNLTSCGNNGDSSVYTGPNYLSMISGYSFSCVESDLRIPAGDYLFEVDLSYRAELGGSPAYCIQTSIDICESTYNLNSPPVTDYLSIKEYKSGQSVANPKIKLFVPVNSQKGISKISYNKFEVRIYDLIGTAQVDSAFFDPIKALKVEKTLNVKENNTFVSFKTLLDDNVNYGLSYDSLYYNSTYEETTAENGLKDYDNGLKISTRNNVVYDSVDFPNLDNNQSYLIKINSTNVEGYPLTLAVRDRNIYRDIVYKKVLPEQTIFEVPSVAPSGGYQVGLVNNSIGDFRSTNVVESLDIVPYPGNWLQTAKISTVGVADSEEPQAPILRDPVNSHKLAPFIYKLTALQKDSRVVFNQTYDSGWVMIGGDTHSIFEGWSNTWVATKNTAYIVFIPGLIQALTYPMLLVYGLYLFIKKEKSLT